MSVQMVLLPVFMLVLLSFILMFRMFTVRTGALKNREVRVSEIAVGQKAWPTKAAQVSNAYSNQFELPVLFFALIAIALPLRQADLITVLLSWVFVVTRYVHAGVYATSNNLTVRFSAFAAGALVLLVMWVYFALKIMLAI